MKTKQTVQSSTSAGMFAVIFIPLILVEAIIGAIVDAIYEAYKFDASLLFLLPFLAVGIYFLTQDNKPQEIKTVSKRKNQPNK